MAKTIRPAVLRGALAASALVTALFGVWVFRSKTVTDSADAFPKESAQSAKTQRSESKPNALTPVSPSEAEGPGGSRGTAAATPDLEAERLRTKRLVALDDARELSRFPPTSRPLDREMTDILKPHGRHETPLSLRAFGTPQTSKEAKAALDDLVVSFTASSYQVDKQTPIQAELVVHKADDPSARRALHIQHTEMAFSNGTDRKDLGAFPIADTGKDGDRTPGDNVYGVELDAKKTALASNRGKLMLKVQFTVDGIDVPLEDALDFDVAMREPARFTDRAVDHIDEGSLVFDLGIHVDEPGAYLVRGLLFDATDQPVGYATTNERLVSGDSTVHLRFFGLLFHETKAKAPFVLRTVTGKRLAEDGERYDSSMVDRSGEVRTRAYAVAEFSNKEWASSSREARIDALRDLAKENPAIVTSKTPTRVIEVGK